MQSPAPGEHDPTTVTGSNTCFDLAYFLSQAPTKTQFSRACFVFAAYYVPPSARRVIPCLRFLKPPGRHIQINRRQRRCLATQVTSMSTISARRCARRTRRIVLVMDQRGQRHYGQAQSVYHTYTTLADSGTGSLCTRDFEGSTVRNYVDRKCFISASALQCGLGVERCQFEHPSHPSRLCSFRR